MTPWHVTEYPTFENDSYIGNTCFFFPLLTFLVHNDCLFSTRTGTASRFQVWRSINYSQHRCSMCQWSNDHHPSIILPSFFHADEISISCRLCLAPGHASCVAAHPRLRAIQGHKHCWLSPDYGIDEDNDNNVLLVKIEGPVWYSIYIHLSSFTCC